MRIFYIIITFMLLSGCHTNNESHNFSFYVGTYTNGNSQGIYNYLLQSNGIMIKTGLAAVSENPSFLAISTDKKYLMAVNEVSNKNMGTVESFLIIEDSLEFISRSLSGGAHPCHINVNNEGFILTANYTGGNVGLLRINKKGKLTPLLDVQIHNGNGITDRQQSPHAHSAWFNPIGKDIISIDLGTNDLWFSHLDTIQQKLIPSNQQKLKMQVGAGPRHLTFHPFRSWIYILNELNNTVTLVKKSNNGRYKIGTSVSTLPNGYNEPNTSADIHISPDGKFLYTSNRGHNTITIYKVNESDGTLSLIGHQPTHGDGPRHFALSPDGKYILVANQNTNNIVSFKRNKITGMLKYISQIEAPSPVCILF